MKLRKILLVLLACSLTLTITLLGSVFAYMFKQTEEVTNDLVPARVSCVVQETFDGTVKSSVAVKNTGNIDAYLRVRPVSYWVNAEGNIVGKKSSMPGFTVADGWIKGTNDTYYYNTPIAPGASTPNLLASSITLASEDGYRQVVEVFAEAIQSKPTGAVTSSWGVTLDENGTITKAP